MAASACLLQKPRGMQQVQVRLALSAIAALALLGAVVQSQSGSAKVDQVGLLQGKSIWSQLEHSATEQERHEQDAIARVIRTTKDAIRLNMAPFLKDSSVRNFRSDMHIARPTRAMGPSTNAQMQLEREVEKAANAERRAMQQEHQAEEGLASEDSLSKAFRAERRINSVRLDAALREMAQEEGTALGVTAGNTNQAFATAPSARSDSLKTSTSTIITDEELRQDISRLEADIGSPAKGALARKQRAVIVLQKKPASVISLQKKPAVKQAPHSKIESELAAMRKELQFVTNTLLQVACAYHRHSEF